MKPFDIMVAVDSEGGIGKGGYLPWSLSADLKHFKQITTKTQDSAKKNAVIMGRRTWESLPEKFRPLSGRLNIVLTKNKNFLLPEGVYSVDNFEKALSLLSEKETENLIENIFVIGGGQLYHEAITHPSCRRIYLTLIHKKFNCDTFFPEFKEKFNLIFSSEVAEENSVSYCFSVYERP